MLIPFIIEKGYGRESIWSPAISSGIESELARKKYSKLYIDGEDYKSCDYDALFGDGQPRLVTVIGTSLSWIPGVIDFFGERSIDVLLVSYQPPENAPVRGVVRIDYVAGVDLMLRHLAACGCRRTALYGAFANSSTDMIKRRAFTEAIAASGSQSAVIFENRSGLADCYESFRERIGEFDSAICVSDIAAASLINRLLADGIEVPKQIQVACFGGSEISKLYRPSITSVIMSNFELGRQTVTAYSYLCRADRRVNLSLRVAGELALRESTCLLDPGCIAIEPRGVRHISAQNFYEDEEVRAFSTLESLLAACDELDRAIISRCLAAVTVERISEELSLAAETVRYRLRRLVSTAGMSSRAELLDYIRANSFGAVFDRG